MIAHPSTYADLGYLYFNLFVYSLLFGWAVISYQFLTNAIISGLVGVFGALEPAPIPDLASRIIVTVTLFLAYELGYWFNHYLSHRVPFLWEFHKVHHSAEVLTPLTNFRVHPVYTWVFVNILAISVAIANGLTHYALGDTAQQYALTNTNLILVVFIHAYVHLQHTQLWIAFRGMAGHIFVSPAHHQVHHSANPAHFNRNFGSCLALWDWIFGTLHVPAKEPEVLHFGVEPDQYPAHTVTGELVAPFLRAAATIRPQATHPEPVTGNRTA
jgi:sterol desaturase/sphingolipid hydroxylase (fatty acid hydroxylase superfamily)